MRIVLALTVFALAGLAGAQDQTGPAGAFGVKAAAIAGTYALYQSEDGEPVTRMVIAARGEKTFTIRGVDQSWAGEGAIDGNKGYYYWIFDDGKTGRTTFTINPDGTLKGHVLGSGLDWWYRANPVKNRTQKR